MIKIELGRQSLHGRDRDAGQAAGVLLWAAAQVGATFVAQHEGTVTVRFDAPDGPPAAPVVRLVNPGELERNESPVEAALRESKELAATRGPLYAVLPESITGLESTRADERTQRDRVINAFGAVWGAVVESHTASPPPVAVVNSGLDPRIVQAAVDQVGSVEGPAPSLILTDARPPDANEASLRFRSPRFEPEPPGGNDPTIVVVPSSVEEREIRYALPGFQHQKTWPQGAPIVLPDQVAVLCVPSQGRALVKALGETVAPIVPPQRQPQPGRRVAEATMRHQHGRQPQTGGGASGPTAT